MSRTDALTGVMNAVTNASSTPVSEAQLIRIISTGEGPGHMVRALFGDCSLDTLDRFAASVGVSPEQIEIAYARAKDRYAAANADIEAARDDAG